MAVTDWCLFDIPSKYVNYLVNDSEKQLGAIIYCGRVLYPVHVSKSEKYKPLFRQEISLYNIDKTILSDCLIDSMIYFVSLRQ